MTRNFKTSGIVIKRRNFGEADRILTVFSKEHGKIQVKAPGVRKINSRRSAHIELLNFSEMSVYKKPSSLLGMVTEAETIEEFSFIKNDLLKTGYSYYICELIDGLCPENQENTRIFYLLKSILFQLQETNNCQQVVEVFEKELLVNLGFGAKHITIESVLERKLRTTRTLQMFQM